MASAQPGKKTLAHTATPFAPLALALVMGAVIPGGTGAGSLSGVEGVSETAAGVTLTPVPCDQVTDFEDCHTRYPAGCGPSKYDAYTNLLKNQLISPPLPNQSIVTYTSLATYDTLNNATPDGLSKGNHINYKAELDKAGERELRELIGYLYYVKEEGPETSNCELSGQPPEGANVDYHIGIGFDPKLAEGMATVSKLSATDRAAFNHSLKINSVVVEMTPHYRSLYENKVWTFGNVNAALGKQVRVAGQLMLDNEHDVSSQNCFRAKTDSDRKLCWRYSVWELHPVVRFQVCAAKAGACDQNSRDWAELDALFAAPAAISDRGDRPSASPEEQPSVARNVTLRALTSLSGLKGSTDLNNR